jgi:predicted TIM-barrel fold metal-dependent hydrolase
MIDLDSIAIVDHHAHPLLHKQATESVGAFRSWLTESTAPEIHAHHVHTGLFFRTAIRWLAQLLECDSTEQAVAAARRAQPEAKWVQRLFQDANISVMLCDYGYGSVDVYDHAQMQEIVPCRVEPILRLETMAEEKILQHKPFADMVDAYAATVEQARDNGYVALKSIIAYRTGLDVEDVSKSDARASFHEIKQNVKTQGSLRLASKPLCDYLLVLALDAARSQDLPVQFHTGFGDSDADLRTANPLHLRTVIERYPGLPLVLLHGGWPYYRELAHLAAIYANVWADLSLAVPFATVGIPTMLRDMMGMAPFSKLMFATDAFTMPEIFWLAARWGRWSLTRVLHEMVADGFLLESEALKAAESILAGNARSLYAL